MATFTKTHKYIMSKVSPVSATDTVDWSNDTIKWMIIDNVTAPSAATHDYINDLSANEVSGTGYTAGGETLGARTITGTTTVNVDVPDTVIAQNAGGFSDGYYAVLYKDSGVESTSIIIGFVPLTGPVGNVSGALTLQIDAGGLFNAS